MNVIRKGGPVCIVRRKGDFDKPVWGVFRRGVDREGQVAKLKVMGEESCDVLMCFGNMSETVKPEQE